MSSLEVKHQLPSNKGMQCDKCGEVTHYPHDEMVFFLNGEEVMVTEQYPDWDRALCNECANVQ